MTETFYLADTAISWFVVASWLATFTASAWFAWLFAWLRFLFVKPSVLVLLYSHVFLQWPACIYAGTVEGFLPEPVALLVVLHGYVLLGLAGAGLTMRVSARRVWEGVRRGQGVYAGELALAATMVAGVCGVLVGMYLAVVPWRATGLYAILVEGVGASEARESSLKLLAKPAAKYAYSFASAAAAPLLAAVAGMLVVTAARARSWGSVAYAVALLGLAGTVVSLSGARIGLVNLVAVVAMVVLFRRGLTLRPTTLPLIVVAALAPAAILSFMREGGSVLDFPGRALEYLGYVWKRAFVTPFEMGLWFMQYEQTSGTMGWGGIPRLAQLFDVRPLDAANLIGLTYAPRVETGVLPTVGANAGYIFTTYAYGGVVLAPLTLLALWALDSALLVYERLRESVLIPTIASVSVSALMFLQSDYTIVWLTHGFGVLLILGLMTSAWLGLVGRFRWGGRVKPAELEEAPVDRAGGRVLGGSEG